MDKIHFIFVFQITNNQRPLIIKVLIEPFRSIRTLGLKFFAALTDIDTYINTLGPEMSVSNFKKLGKLFIFK